MFTKPILTGYAITSFQRPPGIAVIFLRYGKNVLRIKPDKMNFESINRKMIEDFLSWLEYKKKYSISTVNLRLAALHAFFRYVQLESPEYLELCSSILAIKSKKNHSQK